MKYKLQNYVCVVFVVQKGQKAKRRIIKMHKQVQRKRE